MRESINARSLQTRLVRVAVPCLSQGGSATQRRGHGSAAISCHAGSCVRETRPVVSAHLHQRILNAISEPVLPPLPVVVGAPHASQDIDNVTPAAAPQPRPSHS